MIKVAMLAIDTALTDRNLKPELVKTEMEKVITLSIPIVAEVNRGPNWRDAK